MIEVEGQSSEAGHCHQFEAASSQCIKLHPFRSQWLPDPERYCNASPSPYSPDLAPADFFLFTPVNTALKKHRNGIVVEVKAASTGCLKDVTEKDFQGVFQVWTVDVQESYFEDF